VIQERGTWMAFNVIALSMFVILIASTGGLINGIKKKNKYVLLTSLEILIASFVIYILAYIYLRNI
jgi:hypothetical protein